MNEPLVTLRGWVGNDVELRDAHGVPVASFRVGSTPRTYKDGGWRDGETLWVTVNVWRALATHVAASVRQGEPVVVHGKLRADVWRREGQPDSVSHVVDASFVGHDLNRGTTTFTKAPRQERMSPQDDEDLKRHLHGLEAPGPQLDAEGIAVA